MKRISKFLNQKGYQLSKDPKWDNIEISQLTRKEIEKDLVEIIIRIKEKDISAHLIYNLFGQFKDKVLCNPYDLIYIPAGTLESGDSKIKNKNEFVTTVGCWIFNKFFIEKDLLGILGYINETINKKLYSKINKKLSYALIEDDITIDILKNYLEKTQFMLQFEVILSPNQDEELLSCTEKINKKKKELFDAHKKELDAGDVAVAEKLEEELLAYAKDLLKDSPAMDTYDSGAGAGWSNFRSFFIDKGMNYNTSTGEYQMVRSNYMDGITAEDYAITAASLSAPVYSRSKKTESGGYYSKLLTSACSHLRIGKPGSDCHTKNYVIATLTDNIIDLWMYSYIIEGNRLVELTSKNRDKYLNKTVKIRYSSCCEMQDGVTICNACAGNFFNRLGITNIGVAVFNVAEKLKAAMLAQFHVNSVSTVEVDLDEVFGLK